MSEANEPGTWSKWATFRFAVVGPLLVAPPEAGELQAQLMVLAQQPWRHPITGKLVQFGVSTIERWYYAARRTPSPIEALRRKVRSDKGEQRTLSAELEAELRAQYQAHPSWSCQLHRDNLVALVKDRPELGEAPSYSSLRRYMLAHAMPRRRRTPRQRPGEQAAAAQHERREVRSYESAYVNALWHLDFHHGSCRIVDSRGVWVKPILLAILDDHSRLVAHLQWYLAETAECLCHGLSQALLKRGLPRAIQHDNGAAMQAGEIVQGLSRLSILQQNTLPYSPHQNGKQEVFWGQVEGRLLAMLESEPNLTLHDLNRATQAWVEVDYHHGRHSETGQTPRNRFLHGQNVGRAAPTVEALRFAMTQTQRRVQRLSDRTITLNGVRFEIPARFSHFRDIYLRFAEWDLGHLWMVDEAGNQLCQLFPLDKAANASGLRRPIAPAPAPLAPPSEPGPPPLLKRIMADYEALGLPPAYLTKETK
ncbi:MAG: transposase family protein [Rhodospirillales bacterium]|nr:transposase family protein [Rhodospirillales bacterium]